jgi:hypothetical protein
MHHDRMVHDPLYAGRRASSKDFKEWRIIIPRSLLIQSSGSDTVNSGINRTGTVGR